MKEFYWPIRIYYEYTDLTGVVYHSNYLNFFERARTEWLRHLGYEQDVLKQQFNLVFVVRSLSLDFFKPARFNEALVIASQVGTLGRASLDFIQELRRSEQGEVLCRANIKLVGIELSSFQPCALPKSLLEDFKHAD